LIVAAATDPGAARGLASAYASLAIAARRRIIEAVLSDAIAEGELADMGLADGPARAAMSAILAGLRPDGAAP